MTPELVAGPVQVRVPATSANLGPGFDTLGLALDLHDDIEARVAGRGLSIAVAGEGAGTVPRDESHFVVRAMRTGFEWLGVRPDGLIIDAVNRIPHARGLGSSAAAIVGGILLARALVVGGDVGLPDEELLRLAADLEGHPDNVAACLLGGLCVAWRDRAGARAVRVDVAVPIRPVVLVPGFESSTYAARGLLPLQVPHADAAWSAGRAALLVAALGGARGGPAALLEATDDRLHQPYRAPSMPASAALVATLRAAGTAAVVSGAGPSVLALARDQAEVARAVSMAPPGWRPLVLAVDERGGDVRSVRPRLSPDGPYGNTPPPPVVAEGE